MSDTTSAPENVETTPVVGESPTDEPKGLRKQLAAANETIKDLQAREMARVYQSLELEVDRGIGKAILKEYDGDITAEAVSEYAKTEYGWEGNQTPTHPDAQQIAQGQQALDQVGQQAGSVPVTPAPETKLAEAEAKGDYRTALGMKASEVASWFGPGKR